MPVMELGLTDSCIFVFLPAGRNSFLSETRKRVYIHLDERNKEPEYREDRK
jgi:hypothetical protein